MIGRPTRLDRPVTERIVDALIRFVHGTDQDLAAIREVRCRYGVQIIVPRTVTNASVNLLESLDV